MWLHYQQCPISTQKNNFLSKTASNVAKATLDAVLRMWLCMVTFAVRFIVEP